MAAELVAQRPQPALVVGCRLRLDRSLLDRLIRDDVATPIAARLAKMGVAMLVLDIPVGG